jgi:ParB/RepB/Spo0J family partition protein
LLWDWRRPRRGRRSGEDGRNEILFVAERSKPKNQKRGIVTRNQEEIAMQVEMRPVGSIRPYDNNPRINDSAVDAVAASIKEFGFNQPIVVDEKSVVIVGHTRLKAALKLGMETVPVYVAAGLTPAQARAYRLADNQTAALSRFDEARLVQELLELQGQNYDLSQTGFAEEEILRLLNADSSPGLVDPDAVPEPPDEPTTRPGDLILLGKHRLLCADSCKREDVDRLLDGAKIHLCNTDPPYGVKVEPRSNNAIAAGLSSFPGEEVKQKKLLNKKCHADGLKHHQSLDLARHPEKARPTGKKLRAKDRPLAKSKMTRTRSASSGLTISFLLASTS